MNRPNGAHINPKLYVAARLVESLVPAYDIKQSDPLEAAATGTGNCVAKAVIAAVMLEKAKLVGAKPALGWNKNIHPQHSVDMFGRPKVLNGHAYLLTTSNGSPYSIAGISFNPSATVNSNWEIFPFNEDTNYAMADTDGVIKATPAGDTVGYVINSWHAGGRAYMEALGVENSVYHGMSEEDMTVRIHAHLVGRGLLISLQNDPGQNGDH